ncbi:unnamed protein product [Prorocentrum cordatum]|uniref:Uncharacterized protein n=1 Tax=Prorocentrum cordatum TaxID=2364126 RepID=A0ABN9XC30_9DINO|nr:unnamed protein product [Polarella glacialis]
MASDEQVKTLIAEGIKVETQPGGAIYNSVVEGIAEQLSTAPLPGGTVYAALEESAKPGGAVHAAFTNEYNRAADEEYPWRAVLRNLTVAQWKATWEALTVDPDSVEAAGEAIEKSGNPADSLRGLSAAHPDNKELEALQTRVAMKHAVRTKWKDLPLPERGGSSEKFRCHLGERAEAGRDQNVRALSRCVLVLYHLTEKRYTSVLTGDQANAAKAEAQRTTVMPWVYYAIKAFKKRPFKPSAARAFDHEILLKDFGLDLAFGEVALSSAAARQSRANDLKRLDADSPQSASKARRLGDPSGTAAPAGRNQSGAAGYDHRASSGARANRWSNVPAAGPPADAPLAAPGTPPAPGRKELVRQMKASLAAVAPGKSAHFFQKWFDDRFTEKGLKQAALQVSREACKNCLYSGRGALEHTFKGCRDTLKNKCAPPCPRCVAAGRLTGNEPPGADASHPAKSVAAQRTTCVGRAPGTLAGPPKSGPDRLGSRHLVGLEVVLNIPAVANATADQRAFQARAFATVNSCIRAAWEESTRARCDAALRSVANRAESDAAAAAFCCFGVRRPAEMRFMAAEELAIETTHAVAFIREQKNDPLGDGWDGPAVGQAAMRADESARAPAPEPAPPRPPRPAAGAAPSRSARPSAVRDSLPDIVRTPPAAPRPRRGGRASGAGALGARVQEMTPEEVRDEVEKFRRTRQDRSLDLEVHDYATLASVCKMRADWWGEGASYSDVYKESIDTGEEATWDPAPRACVPLRLQARMGAGPAWRLAVAAASRRLAFDAIDARTLLCSGMGLLAACTELEPLLKSTPHSYVQTRHCEELFLDHLGAVQAAVAAAGDADSTAAVEEGGLLKAAPAPSWTPPRSARELLGPGVPTPPPRERRAVPALGAPSGDSGDNGGPLPHVLPLVAAAGCKVGAMIFNAVHSTAPHAMQARLNADGRFLENLDAGELGDEMSKCEVRCPAQRYVGEEAPCLVCKTQSGSRPRQQPSPRCPGELFLPRPEAPAPPLGAESELAARLAQESLSADVGAAEAQYLLGVAIRAEPLGGELSLDCLGASRLPARHDLPFWDSSLEAGGASASSWPCAARHPASLRAALAGGAEDPPLASGAADEGAGSPDALACFGRHCPAPSPREAAIALGPRLLRIRRLGGHPSLCLRPPAGDAWRCCNAAFCGRPAAPGGRVPGGGPEATAAGELICERCGCARYCSKACRATHRVAHAFRPPGPAGGRRAARRSARCCRRCPRGARAAVRRQAMIYAVADIFKSCGSCSRQCSRTFGALCDPLRRVLDRPLGSYAFATGAVNLLSGLLSILSLVGDMNCSGGDSSAKLYAMMNVGACIMHVGFALYLQQKLVAGLQRNAALGHQGSTARQLMKEAGDIVLYDVGFCIYVFLFIAAFALQFWGLSVLGNCRNPGMVWGGSANPRGALLQERCCVRPLLVLRHVVRRLLRPAPERHVAAARGGQAPAAARAHGARQGPPSPRRALLRDADARPVGEACGRPASSSVPRRSPRASRAAPAQARRGPRRPSEKEEHARPAGGSPPVPPPPRGPRFVCPLLPHRYALQRRGAGAALCLTPGVFALAVSGGHPGRGGPRRSIGLSRFGPGARQGS